MNHSPEQLQRENKRLEAQCQGLEAQLADLQKDYERVSRSEARYRQVVENSPISIIFASPDGQLTEANAAFEKQSGFSVEDLQRSGFNLFTDPGLEANGKRSYMLRALAGETVIEPPTNFYNLRPVFGEEVAPRFIRGQGHYFPIRNERGEVQEIVEMSRSVPDLLEAQAEMQVQRDHAAQEKIRLLSSVPLVANLLLRTPNYTQILPDVLRLLGEAAGSDRCCFITTKSEPESGKTRMEVLSEWQSATTPDWTESAPVLYWEDFGDDLARLARGEVLNYLADEQEEPVRSLLQAQAITSVLYVPIITAEGFSGEIGFESSGEPRLFDEAEIAILQIAADSIVAAIERRKKDEALEASEKRFRELFEASNDYIHFLDFEPPIPCDLPIEEQIDLIYSSSRFTDVNPATAKGFNLNQAEIVGRSLAICHSPNSNGHRSLMRRMLENGWQVINAESEDIGPNGERRYWLSNLFGSTENGYVVRAWGITSNITPLKEAQQALLAAEQDRAQRLQTIATLANQLLRSSDYTAVLPEVLKVLGKTAGSARCSLFKNVPHPKTGKAAVQLHTQWCQDEVPRSTEGIPKLESALLWEYFPDFEIRLTRGEAMSTLVANLEEPARNLLQVLGIVSMMMVPIVVDDRFWGVFSFDYCREARFLDEADRAVFAIAADSIAAAIDRDRIQKAMLQAERQKAQDLERFNTELQQALKQLQARDRILEATATAANALLIAENLDEAVSRALKTIGESLETDRINVIEIEAHDATSNLSQVGWRILNEWHSSHAVSQRLHPEHWQGDHTGIESWLEHFASGQSLSRLLEEMPEPFRSGQAAIGVKACHTVPIFVAGRHWGNLGIDDCREAKRRDPADLAVLKTAAAFIGSAIQRDRTQKEILQAEQKRAHELERVNDKLQQALENLLARDLLLTTVAEVTKNLLDSSSNDLERVISIALQMLGERIGCDRINVLENCGQPSTELPDYKIVYEWASFGTLQQISHPNHEGLSKSFVEQYLQNDGFGGLVDEWPEPIRSTFKALNIQSSYSVPIWLGEEFWGVIAFDYCQEARQISSSTVAVLKTAAACIGGVIQRDRNQKAILQAEEVRALELEQFNTELQQAIGNLQARDRILRVTAEAANNLLTRDDLNAAVNSALQAIGESLDTDRIAVLEFEHFNDAVDPSKIGWEILYEWHSAHTVSQLHSEQCLGTFEALEFILEDFSRMQSISYLLEELPEPFRSGQAAIGVKALHGVPILVEGRLWGSLGIDDCRNAKHRDLSELAVLKTVAACIGSAIQRDRTQLAMLQVEQVRAVELDKTNQTLKKSLNRLAANPDLNPFLGYVLLEITQQLDLDFAALRLYDTQAQTLPLELQVLNGQIKYRSEVIAPEAYLNLSIDDIPNWDQWLQTQQPLMVNLNAADDLVYLQDTYNYQARQLQLQVVINILLTLGETPIGYLALGSTQPTSFTAEELSLAKALAQQATLAIQLSQLLEEVKQSVLFEERNRVARDIHDTLAQTLGGIVIQLQAAKFFSPLNPAESMKHMMTARDLAKEGLAEARRSVWTLCEDGRQYQDLAATISEVSQQLTAYDPVQANLIVQGEPYLIEPDLGLNLLRIAQEGINNVVRHAQTTTLTVHLTYEPFQISLTIRDEGCGFDPDMPVGGFGLAGIQQRCDRLGAEFKLTSTKGKGTTVQIKCATVPVRMPSL